MENRTGSAGPARRPVTYPQAESGSLRLLLVYRATDRTDTEFGPPEIQVVGTCGPVRGADAEHVAAVRRLYTAHRAVAAPAGLQARKVVSAFGRLLENFQRNAKHNTPPPAPCTEP